MVCNITTITFDDECFAIQNTIAKNRSAYISEFLKARHNNYLRQAHCWETVKINLSNKIVSVNIQEMGWFLWLNFQLTEFMHFYIFGLIWNRLKVQKLEAVSTSILIRKDIENIQSNTPIWNTDAVKLKVFVIAVNLVSTEAWVWTKTHISITNNQVRR